MANGRKQTRICINFDVECLQRLRLIAAKKGVPYSYLIRKSVEQYVAKFGKELLENGDHS